VVRGGENPTPYLHHPLAARFLAIVAFDPPPLSGGSSQDHGVPTMPDPLAGLPPRFLRTPEAARFLGLSGRTLEKHRTYGTGPKYRKIGGRVVYALDDLKTWADLGAKTSTSDPGAGTVFPAKRRAAAGTTASQIYRR
jgi:predicted DNA-binding transcriptional regulator AlpA